MTRQNLNTIKSLISFYTAHLKETYDNDLKFYEDHEDLIILERDVEDELYTLKYKNMKQPNRETKWYFKSKIESYDDMTMFFDHLFKDDLLYHPEDNPYTILDEDDKRLFTNEECVYLEQRIKDCYWVCEDPCEYILTNLYTLN